MPTTELAVADADAAMAEPWPISAEIWSCGRARGSGRVPTRPGASVAARGDSK
jgi:hypothetical protein